jgi:agmatine/peptidylarginine deiminase
MPAEWEPQSMVQLTWPHKDTDWAPMLGEITDTYLQMAREIAKREPLLIVVPSRNDLPREVLEMENTTVFECPTNDTWARDHGFLTIVRSERAGVTAKRLSETSAKRLSTRSNLFACQSKNGAQEERGNEERLRSQELVLLDFQFNGWGDKFPADLDNAINRRLYDEGRVQGEYVDQLDFVLEGGSIESDGRGTIFTTTGCLMAPHRNQPMTQQQIEERLKQVLGAERIVWIDHGQLTGDDTDGHIDTLVRICPDDTLLYMGCDDPQDEQYEELHLMEQQLRSLRTLDGRPYRLLKLPMPAAIYDDGDRLPATYANFLVINGAVLCPTYGQPDLDAEALRLIGEAFPGRDIVGIDCRPIIRQHGSLHCCTMQFPIGLKL